MCCAADLLAHNANKATTNNDVHRAENLITVFYLLQTAHLTPDSKDRKRRRIASEMAICKRQKSIV
jgi:hypothetical protein